MAKRNPPFPFCGNLSAYLIKGLIKKNFFISPLIQSWLSYRQVALHNATQHDDWQQYGHFALNSKRIEPTRFATDHEMVKSSVRIRQWPNAIHLFLFVEPFQPAAALRIDPSTEPHLTQVYQIICFCFPRYDHSLFHLTANWNRM